MKSTVTLLFVAAAVLSPTFARCETKPDPKTYDPYVGIYRLAADETLSIARFDFAEGQDRLTLLDFRSGALRILQPAANDTFTAGPGLFVPAPVESTLRFTRDPRGNVAGLVWQQSRAADRTATRVDAYTQEAVTFRNGDATLSGTLTLPRGRRRSAAVVFVHGSGPLGRNFFGPLQHFFVQHGIAVLAFDKRGVGASTGSVPASFDEYAADVVAGVALLRSRRDIDPKKIGLWGASQGGWIAPLAASKSRDVAFVILHAGPAVSPGRNDVLNAKHLLRADRFSDADVDEAMRFVEQKIAFARTGEGWDALQATAEKLKERKWFGLVRAPAPKESPSWQARRLIQDFDPVPVLERTRIPLLAFFGERDTEAPVEENKEAMEAALRRAGNRDATIVVLPRANHLFLEAVTGSKKELPTLKNFNVAYFDAMESWLRKHRYASK